MNFVLVARKYGFEHEVIEVFDSFRDAEQYARIWQSYMEYRGELNNYRDVFITDELSYSNNRMDPTKIDIAAIFPIR